MKFAIIAAGDGSRLAAEGVSLPKPLVRVVGEALIDRLIRIFMENDADEIVVICNDRMSQVVEHLSQLQHDGLNGSPIPLRYVVKSTPSSMHSFYEISRFLTDGPFILTTVDTVFRENEFADYVRAFRQSTVDGLMGVTDYIDDEKPLYVGVDSSSCEMQGVRPMITGFYDSEADLPPSTLHPSPSTKYISAGIYGLHENALLTLDGCMKRHESRMRNFQRALLADSLCLEAYPFSKVFDIDHASDIAKAEQFL